MTVKNPRTCLLTLTNSCVLRCKMCRLWQLDTLREEVSIADCKRFIDSLADFGPEPMEVHLIGGEPLIKNGILDLIKHISSKGSRTVMTSCGYTINEDMSRELIDSGLSMLNLSVDSLDQRIHNFLRGKDDSFQRVMEAAEYLVKYKKDGFRLGINTVISAINLETLPALAEWVNNQSSLDSIYFMAVMRPFGSSQDWAWFEKGEFASLWPVDFPRVEKVLDELIALKKKGSKIENPFGQLQTFKSYFRNPLDFVKTNRCNVSDQAINVNAIGDMYLCFFMDKLGNIRSDNAVNLWNSEKAGAIRNRMHACRNNCELVVNCYYEEGKP